MQAKVEQVVEEIRPLIQSVGADATVVSVEDGVALIELTARIDAAQHDPMRLRAFIERELTEEIPELTEVRFERGQPEARKRPPAVTIEVAAPPEGADTCVFTLDRAVAEDNSALFENAAEAEGWPLVQAIFGVEGVASVMVKDKLVLVSRSTGEWDALIESVKGAITAHFEGNPGPVDEESIRARIQTLLDDDINPAVASHGGYIELLDVKGSAIYVHMGGGCQGCGMAAVTLKQGVERAIFEAVPEVTQIFDTTDHAAGENPYYRG